jgi:hypothetical protein
MLIDNNAPDSDCILLRENGFAITISRDENDRVHIDIRKYQGAGGKVQLILGEESRVNHL